MKQRHADDRASPADRSTAVAFVAGDDRSVTVRRSLFKLGVFPGWIVLGAVLLLSALGLWLPLAYQLAPFVASLVVLGLPHGAIDHLVPWRARSVAVTPIRLGIVGGLYLALGSCVLLTWYLAPVVAFVGFVAVTWLHWGQGELYPLIALAGADYLDDEPGRWLAVLARGSLPMLVPLVAFPDQYRLVAETLVGLFGVAELGLAATLFTPQGRAITAVVVAITCGVSTLRGFLRTDDRRTWLFDVSELAFLCAYFSLVPPILAVGCYFCFWHSLRHVVRLIALDGRSVAAIRAGSLLRACARFGRDALPLTLLSIVLVAATAVLLGATREPLELVGVYLVVIAALTVPHVVIVSWLDREQGLWLTGTSPG